MLPGAGVGAGELPARLPAHRRSVRSVLIVVGGGLLYSTGAEVYALQRPAPAPRWFGFHEVFHALTVVAFTAHYTAISLATY